MEKSCKSCGAIMYCKVKTKIYCSDCAHKRQLKRMAEWRANNLKIRCIDCKRHYSVKKTDKSIKLCPKCNSNQKPEPTEDIRESFVTVKNKIKKAHNENLSKLKNPRCRVCASRISPGEEFIALDDMLFCSSECYSLRIDEKTIIYRRNR